MQDAIYWIAKLNLKDHPEGGFYREVYRSGESIEGIHLKDKRKGHRNLATSIYFLLKTGEKSLLHRLKSDETWYYHFGSPIHIYCIDIHGNMKEVVIGPDIENHEYPQYTIPEGTIFGGLVHGNNSFCLASCMVAPGFSFDDFQLLSREFMLDKYPRYRDIILKLTVETKNSTLYY
jgi:predicted cupin superfamily sugar epimerase